MLIKYKFADGTISEVEVSEELYAIHEKMVAEEKRNHWKNTRRHISLSYLNEHEVDIEAQDSDPLIDVIKHGDEAKLRSAITSLSDKQRELVEKVFFEDMSLRQLAKGMGVSHQALSQQIATIYKILKKLL